MMETQRPGGVQDTWEVFFEAVTGSRCLASGGVSPLPADEDHAHPGVRAMQRARRCAWTHARHVRGLSMFESIRLSQRLADAFAKWTRSPTCRDPEELRAALRATEAHSRQPESLETHAAFVEAFAVLSGLESYGSPMETALDAYRAVGGERRAAGA